MEPSVPVTELLRAMGEGEASASEELLQRLQGELRSLARAQLKRAPVGETWQPTALLNEAWLRMVGRDDAAWENRRHFFFVAARAMHDILVEEARRRATSKRGGGWTRHDLETLEIPTDARAEDLVALDEALTRLEGRDARAAEVVRLRFFAGLSEREVAAALDVSLSTVQREWRYARVRLLSDLLGDQATVEE